MMPGLWIVTGGSLLEILLGHCPYGSHASRMVTKPGSFLLFVMAGRGRVPILCGGWRIFPMVPILNKGVAFFVKGTLESDFSRKL